MGILITIWEVYQSSDEELDPGNVTSTISDLTTSDSVRCFWTEWITNIAAYNSLFKVTKMTSDNSIDKTGVTGYTTQVHSSVTTDMTIGNACVRWYKTKPLSNFLLR